MIIALIEEAVAAGARRQRACQALGLSARTVERWKRQGGDDRRNGPKTAPPNKLSAVEQRRILKVIDSPEYRDLSPNQIVPRLADDDTYYGSESTYRHNPSGTSSPCSISIPYTPISDSKLSTIVPGQLLGLVMRRSRSPVRSRIA